MAQTATVDLAAGSVRVTVTPTGVTQRRVELDA